MTDIWIVDKKPSMVEYINRENRDGEDEAVKIH